MGTFNWKRRSAGATGDPRQVLHAAAAGQPIAADWLGNFRQQPATLLSNQRYASMPAAHDRTCHHILPLRALAVQTLDPRPGEIIVDVACGTGQATLALARHAGRPAVEPANEFVSHRGQS